MFYKSKVDELIGVYSRNGRADEELASEIYKHSIDEDFSILSGDFSESTFPINLLFDHFDDENKFPSVFIKSVPIFNNVISYILTLPEGFEIELMRPEQYKDNQINEILQSEELCHALYFIYAVISNDNNAIDALPEALIALLFMMIYSTKGMNCIWALYLLTIISERKLEELESFQYVSRVGEILKYCRDEKIKKFAFMALEPFFSLSDDYKRKNKIFDFIHSKFFQYTPTIKNAALLLTLKYIKSSEKCFKHALRCDLLGTCISHLKPGNTEMLKSVCSIIGFIVENGSDIVLRDNVTYERLIQQLGALSMSTNPDITIPVFSLIELFLVNNERSIPMLSNSVIPKSICMAFERGSIQEKVAAVRVIGHFLRNCTPDLIALLVSNDFIIPCLGTFAYIDIDTQANVLQGILRMFSMEQSIWDSIDYETLMDCMEEIHEMNNENSSTVEMIIAKMESLKAD